MRRLALVLVIVLLLLLLLVVPIGMGAGMDGVTCPDCVLSAALCLAGLLGLGVIISVEFARQRVATTLAVLATEGGPGVPERPPK